MLPCRLALLALISAGCGAAPQPVDAGEETSSDAPETDASPSCGLRDDACPERPPMWGVPCATGLSCTWPSDRCDDLYRASCVAGRWQSVGPDNATCSSATTAPNTDACDTPFTGVNTGSVTMRIDGDAFVWGTQGLPMIPVTLVFDGEAAALDCVHATLRVTYEGAATSSPGYRGSRIRCAETRFTALIAPDALPCEDRRYDVVVTATVDGVGTASASASLLGGTGARCE